MTADRATRRCGWFCESAIDAMADAVVGTDPEDRVILWNPAAKRLYGYSAAEAMGRPAQDVVGAARLTTTVVRATRGFPSAACAFTAI